MKKNLNRIVKIVLAAGLVLGLVVEVPVIPVLSLGPVVIKTAEAQPARRAARRQDRRVRRHVAAGAALVALPVGYRTVVVNGWTYYYYDGVYYEAVEEDGQTVYIIVDDPNN